jgi:hypothetical protein
MPWKIFKNENEHCVYKVDEEGNQMGKSLGCHDSEKEAKEQMAALYASEEGKSFQMDGEQGESEVEQGGSQKHLGEEGEHRPAPLPVKMSLTEHMRMIEEAWYGTDGYHYSDYIQEIYDDYIVVSRKNACYKVPYTVGMGDEGGITFAPMNEWDEVKLKREWVAKNFYVKEIGGDRLGFYGHLWGNAEQTDLHGEYFAKDTEGLAELFEQLSFIPLTYQHGADETLKATVFGKVDTMTDDEVGKWMEAQIINHNMYRRYVQPLVQSGKLYPSSETMPLAKKSADDGKITYWVDSFITLTPTPAEYRMLDVPVSEVKAFYKSVGEITDEKLDELFGDKEQEDADGIEKIRIQARQRQLELEASV